MANLKDLERIAFGDIEIVGNFGVVTVDERTGRVYQEVREKNFVFPQINNIIRNSILQLFTMCNISTMPSSIFPLFHSVGHASDHQHLGPLFENVMLTNGINPDSFIDPLMGIDGLIIAEASSNSVATAGTRWGAPTFSLWRATNNRVYRRWDWPSANGIGTFNKIVLSRLNRREVREIANFTSLDFLVSHVDTLPTSIPGGSVGGDHPDCWRTLSMSSTVLSLGRFVINSNGMSYHVLNISRAELNFVPGNGNFMCRNANNSNIVYFISSSGSNIFNIHTIDITTLTLLSVRTITLTNANFGNGANSLLIFTNNLNQLQVYCNHLTNLGIMEFIINPDNGNIMSSRRMRSEITFGAWGLFSPSMVVLSISGNIVYVSLGVQTFFAFDTQTGLFTAGVNENPVTSIAATSYNKGGIIESGGTGIGIPRTFSFNNAFYNVRYSTANSWQYMKHISNPTLDFVPTAAKRFSSPITKTSNHAMFVDYTLTLA